MTKFVSTRSLSTRSLTGWLAATCGFWVLFAGTILGTSHRCHAQTRAAARAKPTDVEVALFDAMASGDIEVRLIAKDSTKGNVLIKNKTERPLAIRLPEVFAALPVAAQFNPFGGGGANFGGLNPGGFNAGGMNGGMNAGMTGGMNGGANQALGGGFQGGQNGGFPGGGANGVGRGNNAFLNGGVFRVEPEKVGKIKITAVCLEHGKPEPHARIEYALRPIESYTQNAATIETVKMLARGEVDQRTAQSVAWHFANGLTWEKLASKVGALHLGGQREPYFSESQIAQGKQIAAEAGRRATEQGFVTPTEAQSLAGTR